MRLEEKKSDARWARTRQRLLAGGRAAFAKRGVEATTVLEIVRAAGVSQPSFYNHFGSKAELAHEIAASYFRADRQAKQAVFAEVEDPAEAIAINVRHTLSVATENPVIAWTLVKSESLRSLIISSDTDPLADMIRQGVEEGRFASDDANTIALAIRGGAFAIMQDILRGSTADESCRCYQELVLRMLGLPPEESASVVRRAQTRLGLGQAA